MMFLDYSQVRNVQMLPMNLKDLALGSRATSSAVSTPAKTRDHFSKTLPLGLLVSD
jgi:hypothetical protein